MTKEEMIAFMNANPVMQLATVEGDKPRVRAILLFKADEKGIIFHTANTKDLYKQLMKNSNVEICFNSPDTQLRVTGVAHVDDDPKLREEIFAHGDIAPSVPDQSVFGLFGVFQQVAVDVQYKTRWIAW